MKEALGILKRPRRVEEHMVGLSPSRFVVSGDPLTRRQLIRMLKNHYRPRSRKCVRQMWDGKGGGKKG